MKSRRIGIAGICLLAALASGAVAQGTLGQGPNQFGTPPLGTPPLGTPPLGMGKPPATAFVPLAGPWTTENVPADQPFGTIDVSDAGKTTAQVRTWAQGRTPMERNELSGRCQVIDDPANSSRYPANAREFCSTYTAMQVITPPVLNYKY